MAKGNATNRLNEILSQGSSVTTNAKSVLDERETSTAPELPIKPTGTPLHDDPEVPDISSLLQSQTLQNTADSNADMEEVFKSIFGQAAGANPQAAGGEGMDNNPLISQLMLMMSEGAGEQAEGQNGEPSYQAQVLKYQTYQVSKVKAQLLVTRFLVHFVNFIYHYRNFTLFQSSPHLYIRGLSVDVLARSFFSIFVGFEIVFVSAYFALLASKGLLRANPKKHFISKAMNFGSMVLPGITRYQPMVETALIYSEGLKIIWSDIALVVMLFGIVSIYG